jgi:hypothetical protein
MDQVEPLTLSEQQVLDALQDDGGYIRTGDVLMYSPEKSIADAFHFEEYVGRDVALEALKTYMARRRWRNIPELLKAA